MLRQLIVIIIHQANTVFTYMLVQKRQQRVVHQHRQRHQQARHQLLQHHRHPPHRQRPPRLQQHQPLRQLNQVFDLILS